MNAPIAPSRMNLLGSSNAASGNALELRGISKMFGALAAISDVTLSVKPGERRAVLGSNGAGKTTLFNCITGDFLPTAGFVRFFGEDVTVFPPHERIRRGLRRTYQISSLFTGLSVMDNVYLGLPRCFAKPLLAGPAPSPTMHSYTQQKCWSRPYT